MKLRLLSFALEDLVTRATRSSLGNVLDLVEKFDSFDNYSVLMILECAYGIRYVELHGRASRMPWSVRQTVIYHKYRVQGEASTWILIAASSKTEVCLDRYIKSCRDLSNINPFEIHVIIIDVALANWRPYITYLTEEITKQVCCIYRGTGWCTYLFGSRTRYW